MANAFRSKQVGRLFDPVLAIALAAATAFASFAMPAAMLEGLVQAIGLDALIAAAAPPLGDTARALIAMVAALLAGAAAWLLLRWLGQLERSMPADAARDEAAPELRRADRHPDAPARRPIFATADLGKSLDEGAMDVIARGWPAHTDAEVEPAAPSEVPDSVEHEIAEIEAIAAEPVSETIDTIEAPEEEPLELTSVEQAAYEEALLAQILPPSMAGGESVTELMARLEAGLVRRDQPAAENTEEVASSETHVPHPLFKAVRAMVMRTF